MRHTRRKERDGLDLARPAPRRRHKTLRQLCALLLGLAGLALLSMAVWGAALPRRLDDALAQHYAAQMSVMQRELFALRRRLAEHEPDAEENAALRDFLQSRQTDGERWDPVWTAARWPGGFLLAQPVQAGAAVLDRSGRFAGIAGEHGTVSPAGSGAGAVPTLVGQALGTLTRQNGVLWVTGLPCSCKAAAGELAVTAQGQYWAGQLAAAPQPDPGGLTLRAPLEDTAHLRARPHDQRRGHGRGRARRVLPRRAVRDGHTREQQGLRGQLAVEAGGRLRAGEPPRARLRGSRRRGVP